MASITNCPHCGGTLRSDQKACPNCGAENPGFVVDSERTIFNPTTIEELKEYCAERNMPLLRMRFFIGEDFREPKAFGIYRDGAEIVVYKNKADGSRAVRYRGNNEAHAVRELHQKLLDECKIRGIDPDTGKDSMSSASSIPAPDGGVPDGCLIFALIPPFIFVSAIYFLLLAIFSRFPEKTSIWPQKRRRLEEKNLKQPIRLAEGLCYSLNQFCYGKPDDSSLTLRERQIKQYSLFWCALPRILFCVLLAVLLIGAKAVVNDRQDANKIYFEDGYYQIGDGNLYYHADDLVYFDADNYATSHSSRKVWFVTKQDGSGDWEVSRLVRLVKGSGKQLANNHMKRYFLGKSWDPSFGGSDFADSRVGQAYQLYDEAYYGEFRKGYYRFDGKLWYRDGDSSWDDWYWCSPGQIHGVYAWTQGNRLIKLSDGLPMTPAKAEEYFLQEDWSEELGGSDYLLYVSSQRASSYDRGYYRMSDGSVYYNNGSTWYRSSGSSWKYEGSSIDSSSSAFDGSYSGYYLDDEWDSDWGGQSYDNWYSSQISSSSSYSRSSSNSGSSWDSWDSDDTDWDSDW